MEYFQGINPGTAAAPPLTATGVAGGSVLFGVRQQPGLVDLTQYFEVSTNLSAWSAAVGVVTNSVTPETDGTQTLHLSLPRPAGGPAFYLRLVIAQD